MGWGSAVHIFDDVIDAVLELTDPDSEYLVSEIVETIYTKVDWEDWDTQDDSKYAPYLTPIRIRLGEVDPDELG